MAFTVLPTDYAGAKAELLASRVTIGRQQAETKQLRDTITKQAATIERLSSLADKWNMECDEMREDNKRLDSVCQEQAARIKALEDALLESLTVITEYSESTYECEMSDYKMCCSEHSRKPHLDWCSAMKAIAAINELIGE